MNRWTIKEATWVRIARPILFLFVFAGAITVNAEGFQGASPKNLKVLPRNTAVADIYKSMVAMQHDLGVQCAFCHAEDPDTKQIDYASDENPRKETARLMMRMTNDINQKYLAQLGEATDVPPISCGNCHLGQMHPPAYASTQAK